MCSWNVLSTLVLVLSVIQLTDAVCLSKEQFLASLDRTKTLVFEATLIQHTTISPLPDGFEAYVEIRRIVQQPQVGWQLTPGSVAHIRNIRPREVDHSLCLPIVRNGEVYLWVTWNTAEGTQTREEGSLQFYPGGLFRSETSTTDPRWSGDRKRVDPDHVDTSMNDRLLHDAAYVQPIPSNNFPLGGNTLARDPYNVLNVCDLAPCPMELNPTCGSDGVLYQNECILRQRACIARQMAQFQDTRQMPISIDYTNLCMDRYEIGLIRQDVVLCESNNLCAYGSLCAVTSGTVSGDDQIFPCDCRLMSCVGEFPGRPLCATDGQTYDNECALRKSMCTTQVVKRVLHTGNCTSNPCLGYMCRWPGERCEVDQTGQPKCVCPDPCPKVVLPVCGSDGMTYDSHCHLERTACLKMRHIWVVYAGPCSEEPQCQALGLHCQGYEVCTRVKAPQVYRRHTPFYYDSNALMKAANSQPIVPRCMCPLCPERGLGDKVCGTDGRTYRSECHLRSSACQAQLYEVKVRSRGPCNACNSKECKYYAICQRNLDGEPQCICPTGCPAVVVDQTVCGTDGQNYESECHLKVRSCAEQRDLYVAHQGPCKTCPAGCPLGYQCRNGECVCRDACPPSTGLVPEVCGTDGQLYRSECELKRQACLLQTEVHVDASGMKCQGQQTGGRTHDSASSVQSDEKQPSACNCNKLGAVSEHCDHTGQCECKQGARGTRCDQCLPDYWGIQNGYECIACSCHPDGALSTTCDPTSGQCECRAGVFGRQCSICADGGRVTKAGCVKTETQPDPQNDLPGDVSLRGSIQVKEPPSESDETTTTGRQFDPHTTLLVRAPVTLEQPVMVELHLMVRLLLDGSLLEYRVTPTEQEQMWVENLQDHQFSLFLVDGGFVECNYLDGRTPDRLFVVRASVPIRPGHVHLVRAGVSANRPWLQLDHHERTGARDIEIRRTGWSGSGTVHMGGYRTIVIGRPLIAPMSKHDAILKTHETYGFSGCLLRFLVQAGTLTRAQEIDLISGDRTELAWLGVERLPSGLSEAPLCTAVQSRPTQSATQDRRLLQSDARQESPRDQMDPCSAQKQPPCHNGGLCFATGTEEYECVCQPGWQGQRCEQVVSIIPQFHGTSFIRLMGPTGKQAMQGKRLFIELGFLVTKTPGLLFLVPPSDTAGNDQFIAAYVNTEGNLVVTGRMGKSQSRLRTQPSWPPSMDSHSSLIMLQYNFTVQPHQWHTLIIDKRNKALIVRLDDRPKQRIRLILPQFRKYPKKQRQKLLAFDLSKSPIYLGGYDLQDDSATFLDIRTGMVGAIQKININGAEVILAGPPISNVPTGERLKNRNTEFWMNVSQWQGPPCGPAYSPCGMDQLKGVCRPLGPRASCACTTPLRLWHILQTQPGTSDDRAEQQACEQRQLELESQKTGLVDIGNAKAKKFNQHDDVQYDELPSQQKQPHPDTVSDTGEKIRTAVPFSLERCGKLAVNFSGNTIFTFENLVQSTSDYNLRVHLRTTSPDGLVLLMIELPDTKQSNQQFNSQRELTMIAVRKGHIELSVNTIFGWLSAESPMRITGQATSTLLQLRSSSSVNDGRCHVIHTVRSGGRVALILDNHMVSGEFLHHARNFRRKNHIYLGGAFLSVTGLPWEYQQNVTACIADLFVSEQEVSLLDSWDEIHGPIRQCS